MCSLKCTHKAMFCYTTEAGKQVLALHVFLVRVVSNYEYSVSLALLVIASVVSEHVSEKKKIFSWNSYNRTSSDIVQ